MDANTQKVLAELIRIGLPSLCFFILAWLIIRTIMLKIELDGPGFTMKAERAVVAAMLSDLLNDVRDLTREERDLFVRILNRKRREGKVTVADLFPDFVLDSEAHRMLRSLQCAHLVRPARRGHWDKDAQVQVTAFGERLAIARPNLFAASGTAFVS